MQTAQRSREQFIKKRLALIKLNTRYSDSYSKDKLRYASSVRDWMAYDGNKFHKSSLFAQVRSINQQATDNVKNYTPVLERARREAEAAKDQLIQDDNTSVASGNSSEIVRGDLDTIETPESILFILPQENDDNPVILNMDNQPIRLNDALAIVPQHSQKPASSDSPVP